MMDFVSGSVGGTAYFGGVAVCLGGAIYYLPNHNASSSSSLDLSCACSSVAAGTLWHVRDLTVAVEPEMTCGLLDFGYLGEPDLGAVLRRLLAARGSLQQFHLHFHPQQHYEYYLKPMWQS